MSNSIVRNVYWFTDNKHELSLRSKIMCLNDLQYQELTSDNCLDISATNKRKIIVLSVKSLDSQVQELLDCFICTERDKNFMLVIVDFKEKDKFIDLLDLNRDELIVRPFNNRYFINRLKSLLNSGIKNSFLSCSGVTLDQQSFEAYVYGQRIILTPSEFRLLQFFLKFPSRAFERGELIRLLHGDNFAISKRSIDFLIVSLRKKLGQEGGLIETVRGIGYRFRDFC